MFLVFVSTCSKPYKSKRSENNRSFKIIQCVEKPFNVYTDFQYHVASRNDSLASTLFKVYAEQWQCITITGKMCEKAMCNFNPPPQPTPFPRNNQNLSATRFVCTERKASGRKTGNLVLINWGGRISHTSTSVLSAYRNEGGRWEEAGQMRQHAGKATGQRCTHHPFEFSLHKTLLVNYEVSNVLHISHTKPGANRIARPHRVRAFDDLFKVRSAMAGELEFYYRHFDMRWEPIVCSQNESHAKDSRRAMGTKRRANDDYFILWSNSAGPLRRNSKTISWADKKEHRFAFI